MTLPIFKAAIRDGMNQKTIDVQKNSETSYTFIISGREFGVTFNSNKNEVDEVYEKAGSSAGIFNCFYSFLHFLKIGTTSTRIRDVLNESDYSISNYFVQQSSMNSNEKSFLTSTPTRGYGSSDLTEQVEHENETSVVVIPENGKLSAIPQKETEDEADSAVKEEVTKPVTIDKDDSCAVLSKDENELLKMLDDEHDVSDIKLESSEIETDEVECHPPSIQRERTGSVVIRAKYERDNLESGKLVLIAEEEHPEYSFDSPLNREERRTRDAETLEKRSKVLLYKSTHNENEYWHRPSLNSECTSDLKKLSETASMTCVGRKKIPMGGRTYYELNPGDEQVDLVYEPAAKPKYRMFGREEKVVAIDDKFVSLKRSERVSEKYSKKHKEEMEKRLKVVEDHDCVCKAWVVDEDTVIAEYGGRDVKKFHRRSEHELKKEQILPFLGLVKDVHDKGYRFCSISNHNLLCSGIGKPVKFTGWKYLAGKDLGQYEYKMEDPTLIPSAMETWVRSSSDEEELMERAKVAEQHAVLMMACESMSAEIASAINSDDIKYENSMITKQNQKYFVKWVQENVKRDSRKEVLLFLNSPTTRKLRSELIDILK
ncbi:hypothetical protein JQC92_16670 [Shewanella sp. 202IG2-18]|uniref:hypothetical protein n=1 Tax=Parashewanella hymeniacidonis TaxID=2807618 RepID=UPI00196056C0|nr:hypothetical protein [Parashewanella hymeniacidonis]MBM7073645.1 hypothetical protein [Parashewanella hymeniacidonis]